MKISILHKTAFCSAGGYIKQKEVVLFLFLKKQRTQMLVIFQESLTLTWNSPVLLGETSRYEMWNSDRRCLATNELHLGLRAFRPFVPNLGQNINKCSLFWMESGSSVSVWVLQRNNGINKEANCINVYLFLFGHCQVIVVSLKFSLSTHSLLFLC